MSQTKQFKVVLLGEGCVGKTSLVLRYCQNTFNDHHLSTLQASYQDKKLNIGGQRAHLSIWDTAGQERFHALGPIYYRDSNGAILVYDITDEDSFVKVKNWVRELRKMLGDNIELCIAGNKIDLEKDRKVDKATALQYSQSVGAKHYDTSAKLDKGVSDMMLDLTKRMLAVAATEKPTSNGRSGGRPRPPVVIVDDEPTDNQRSGGCC